MSDDADVTVYRQYCPPGVKRVIASGGSAFIGEVDESTVFKYPLAPGGDISRLEVERKLLSIIGPHPRIIRLKNFSDTGIYLERAVNGSLADYLLESDDPSPSIQQRLSWCREAAEAIAYIHSYRILHCDIQPTNLLLDEKFHLKLADFQGRLLSEKMKYFSTVGASSPANSPVPEMIFLKRISKQISLLLGVPYISSLWAMFFFQILLTGRMNGAKRSKKGL